METISEITYQGNKNRLMKILKPFIEDNLDDEMVYIEPFGGGMNSFTPISSQEKIANDFNEYNIALWTDLKIKGVNNVISEWAPYIGILSNCEDKPNGENYIAAKELYLDMKKDCLSNGDKYPKSLLGFVACSCSFGGGWWNGFTGYNPKRGENYIKQAVNALKKHYNSAVNIDNSKFIHGDYFNMDIPDNAFIYCDPPYANTKKYKDDFDNDRFWEWCRQIIATKDNVKILISEYTAPDDFICVWSVNVQDKMGSKSMNKTEKLFIHMSQLSEFNLSSLPTVKLSQNDIMEMVKKAVNEFLTENTLDELEAYHGTMASFDKFDMSFMGTGEGSQVYGYGLYFTDVYNTGEWYAVSIAYDKGTKNKTIKRSETKTVLTYFTAMLYNIKGWEKGKYSIEEIHNRALIQYEKLPVKNSRTETAKNLLLNCKSIREIQDTISNLKKEVTNNVEKFIYKVEIPDGPYINWQESDPVFLQNIYNKFKERFDISHVNMKKVKTFGDLFEKIRGWRSKKDYAAKGEIIPQKELSEYLYSLGYKGIQVRTGHRIGGDGRGMNFVVFNDKDVKLIEKNNMKTNK